jgi:hypothetical protein
MTDEASSGAERWRQVGDICWNVLNRPAHERASIVDEACVDDPDLRREVESLLAVQSAVPTFLETPAGEIAADLLATDDNLTGRRLGPYVIGECVGSGGMGDVYRARDEHLARDIALKILPGRLCRERRRFSAIMAEAQVVASLNHPNIAAIYGFEKTNGLRALVLEFVEGVHSPIALLKVQSTSMRPCRSRDRLPKDWRRRTKAGSCIAISNRPISSCATTDGEAARLWPGDGLPRRSRHRMARVAPCWDARLCQPRATERTRDGSAHRHLGIRRRVLRAAVRTRAFAGNTTSDIVNAVLRQRIDWSVLPAATPRPVRALLTRCLERDVRQRLRDIGEARIALEQVSRTADGETPSFAETREATREQLATRAMVDCRL